MSDFRKSLMFYVVTAAVLTVVMATNSNHIREQTIYNRYHLVLAESLWNGQGWTLCRGQQFARFLPGQHGLGRDEHFGAGESRVF